MASISFRHIWKIYPGNVEAVKDFNLEIADKEFIVLVGPSGCGKSTTLRMLADLEPITKGELYIGDRLVNDVPSKERDIAMVFQSYALYPHKTVFKNMSFALELRKVPKAEIERTVKAIAQTLDITHLLDRKPKALSGGQRQRVALGRAMVRNPAVFLLDEPLSNLDAKLRASMRTELIQLHQKLGTTFVYVTHDQTEAMTMGDRIVVMNEGVIQQVDTPQTLYEKPCNMFVAGFIGTPQMNFIDGVLKKDETGYFLEIGSDKIYIRPERVNDSWAGYEGKQVKAGIRPEDIYDDEAFLSANANAVIKAKVEVREMMGSEVYLYLDYNGNRFTVRVPSSTTSNMGDTISAGIDTRKIHLFDPETEESLIV